MTLRKAKCSVNENSTPMCCNIACTISRATIRTKARTYSQLSPVSLLYHSHRYLAEWPPYVLTNSGRSVFLLCVRPPLSGFAHSFSPNSQFIIPPALTDPNPLPRSLRLWFRRASTMYLACSHHILAALVPQSNRGLAMFLPCVLPLSLCSSRIGAACLPPSRSSQSLFLTLL